MIKIQTILDAVALVYAILFFPAPFFWLIIHPGIHFWRRYGNRSFWVALPLWTAFAIAVVLLRHRPAGRPALRSLRWRSRSVSAVTTTSD